MFPKYFLPSRKYRGFFSADTAMVLNGKLYGKPSTVDEAVQFLKDFSGNTHTVITSMALYNGKLHYLATRTAKTLVTFTELSQEVYRYRRVAQCGRSLPNSGRRLLLYQKNWRDQQLCVRLATLWILWYVKGAGLFVDWQRIKLPVFTKDCVSL